MFRIDWFADDEGARLFGFALILWIKAERNSVANSNLSPDPRPVPLEKSLQRESKQVLSGGLLEA